MKTSVAFWSLYFALLLWAALACGCMLPAPWTRDRAAIVEKAEGKADVARDAVLRRAQAETAVAEIALRSAPPSRPVEIAREATASAGSMQAQALGPLAEADRQRLEKLVADLQSENAAIRNEAERDRADDAQRAARASAALSEANARVDAAEAKLAAAYERERSLASLVRKAVWAAIGLGVLAVVAGVAVVAIKLNLGGSLSLAQSTLGHVVTGVEKLRSTAPDAVAQLETILGRAMDRVNKDLVATLKPSAGSPQAS